MVRLQKLGALSGLLLVLSQIEHSSCAGAPCMNSHHGCPGKRIEVYKDEPEHGRAKSHCCEKGKAAEESEKKADGCTATDCQSTAMSGGDLCSSTGKRTITSSGKSFTFVEAIRDDCTLPNGDAGVTALCCPSNSTDLMLTTLMGVEPHEFPHFARLEVSNGHMNNICGGTVYNERHVITASHCVVDKASFGPDDKEKMTIFLNIAISGKKTDNKYDIEDIYIHPNASLIQKNEKKQPLNNDIAILKLSRDITFSDKIKALPLAPKGFNPKDFADTAIIMGFGNTDTMTTSKKLQKADAYIRDSKENTRKGSRYPQHHKDVDQLLFLGGFQHGISSPSGSGGDSGGPAVCRDKNGEAVLCGLTSFGPENKENCEREKNEKQCFPTSYVKVDYFRDWIETTAGSQKKATVMKQPLYGKDVSPDNHPLQVEISSGNKNDHKCGGTLIAKDVVVTAAHCVAEDNGSMKQGLTVKQGSSSQSVKSIKVLDDFKRVGNKNTGRTRRIAVFATKATWDDPYYMNDLALVKLSGAFSVSKFPSLPKSEATPGDATEIAWATDAKRKGKLTERQFTLMTHTECQKRMDRLSHTGKNIKVDENIVCGVEKYSGGSKCDRTLGGGVFCDGGKTLCGVQAFRLCQFAVPNAFIDVGFNNDWIQKNIKHLK